ncbi:MAG: hypothetical protein AAGU19_02460 [Prolixibacteraceae bacterium]
MINYLLIILYNLLDVVKIPLVGQLKGNELMVLLVLPFLYRSNEFSKYPLLRKICLTLLALMACQIITDIFVVNSAAEDYLRGWSQTIIGLLSVIFLFKVLNGYKAITLFLVISGIRALVSEPMGIDLESSNEMTFFKFRIAPAVTDFLYGVAIWLHYKGKTKPIPVLFLVFGLISFALDFRSKGLTMIVSAVLLFLFYSGFKFKRAYVIAGSVTMIILFQALYTVYVNAALKGKFGGEHAAQQLERLENPYNPFSLLMTGRGETFAAVEAIKDAPVFGHGSWARDETLKYYRIILKYHQDEFNEVKAAKYGGLIPSHSFIMGAWVNYGFFAFLAVIFLLFLLMKMAIPLIKSGQSLPVYPIFIPITAGMIWMFMFSNFQQVRFSIPDIAAIFLTSYYLLQRQQLPVQDEANDDPAYPAFSRN